MSQRKLTLDEIYGPRSDEFAEMAKEAADLGRPDLAVGFTALAYQERERENLIAFFEVARRA